MIKNILKKLTLGVSLAAFLGLSAQAQLLGTFQTTGPNQVPGYVPGHTLVGGPAPAAFSFTGSITVTTVGSYTTGILTVTPPAGATTPVIPYGSVITGSGVTAGTVVVSNYNPNTNSYTVVTTGGTIVGVSSETLTATPKISTSMQDTALNTAPTYASGGCTGGSPGFSAASTVSNWSFTNGSSVCTGGNTVTFTFPSAPTSWACQAVSTLNGSTDIYISTGSASATAVVLTDYSATGSAQNTKANDVITGSCVPR